MENIMDEVKKKKVSYSQFSTYFTCPHRWKLDYVDKLKEFEDNLIMSFGTAIHETVQLYLKVLYNKGDVTAAKVDLIKFFIWSFKKEIKKKKIPHTSTEFNEFIEDGRNIIREFCDPTNLYRYFQKGKWELVDIENELNVDFHNNININGFIDIIFREKTTGNIRIIDFKTSNMPWTSYKKEDFTKTSQLLLYKALYSKQYNVPLSKINVEFIILIRKLYENAKYLQSRIQIFKPSAHQKDVMLVLEEFSKFVDACFTPDGIQKVNGIYPKIPGSGKKNCKYCPYLKNGKCDGIPDLIK
jgi:hypothetical protein